MRLNPLIQHNYNLTFPSELPSMATTAPESWVEMQDPGLHPQAAESASYEGPRLTVC